MAEVEKKQRSRGFYWVLESDYVGKTEWRIAEWDGHSWSVPGWDAGCKDSDFVQIDENKVDRK